VPEKASKPARRSVREERGEVPTQSDRGERRNACVMRYMIPLRGPGQNSRGDEPRSRAASLSSSRRGPSNQPPWEEMIHRNRRNLRKNRNFAVPQENSIAQRPHPVGEGLASTATRNLEKGGNLTIQETYLSQQIKSYCKRVSAHPSSYAGGKSFFVDSERGGTGAEGGGTSSHPSAG